MLRLCMCALFVGSLLVASLNAYPSEGHTHQDQNQVQTDLALIARRLVHAATWTAAAINGATDSYPMISVISIDDSAKDGKSTGKIHFLLASGDHIKVEPNKKTEVSFLLTEEQNKECSNRGVNPMGHGCARVVISGEVVKLDNTADGYRKIKDAFVRRHPIARGWLGWISMTVGGVNPWYLYELNIKKIEIMGAGEYLGYQTVTPEEYYSANVE